MFWWVSWTLSRRTPVNQMLSNKQRHFLMSRGRHFLDLPLTIKRFLIYVRALMTLTMHKRMRFSLKECFHKIFIKHWNWDIENTEYIFYENAILSNMNALSGRILPPLYTVHGLGLNICRAVLLCKNKEKQIIKTIKYIQNR